MSVAAALSAGLVFLAEIGDKTQLLVLVLAARHGVARVLAAIGVAASVLTALAVAGGRVVGTVLPVAVVVPVAGIAFIGFGIFTLVSSRGARAEGADGPDATGRVSARGSLLAIAGAFFLAELGDKTQLSVVALAADPGAAASAAGWGASASGLDGVGPVLGIWLGSTVGLLAADGIAVALGSALGRRVPERLMSRISGVVFVVFGTAMLLFGRAGNAT